MTSKQVAHSTVDSKLKECGYCKEKAEWRFKNGWGALACAGWFAGQCAGEPLDMAQPIMPTKGPRKRSLDKEDNYNEWVKKRLREFWPLGSSTC